MLMDSGYWEFSHLRWGDVNANWAGTKFYANENPHNLPWNQPLNDTNFNLCGNVMAHIGVDTVPYTVHTGHTFHGMYAKPCVKGSC